MGRVKSRPRMHEIVSESSKNISCAYIGTHNLQVKIVVSPNVSEIYPFYQQQSLCILSHMTFVC